MSYTANTFPFDVRPHDGSWLEALPESLYYEAAYPRDGTRELTFWPWVADASERPGVDLAVSNVRLLPHPPGALAADPKAKPAYYGLPSPQRFLAIGLAVRPVYHGDRWAEAERAVKTLRALGTFRFFVGTKPYADGPLDQVLGWRGDPSREAANLDEFWPLVVTLLTKDGRKEELVSKASPLTIPSEQVFRLEVRFPEPLRFAEDVRLRAYVVGCRLREVA